MNPTFIHDLYFLGSQKSASAGLAGWHCCQAQQLLTFVLDGHHNMRSMAMATYMITVSVSAGAFVP